MPNLGLEKGKNDSRVRENRPMTKSLKAELEGDHGDMLKRRNRSASRSSSSIRGNRSRNNNSNRNSEGNINRTRSRSSNTINKRSRNNKSNNRNDKCNNWKHIGNDNSIDRAIAQQRHQEQQLQ